MNPNPLGYSPDKVNDRSGFTRAGETVINWTVPEHGEFVILETDSNRQILSRDKAIALEMSLNAALPHMAQKIEP